MLVLVVIVLSFLYVFVIVCSVSRLVVWLFGLLSDFIVMCR